MWKSNFPPQFLVALAASGGALIFGIILGWSAPTAEQVIKNDDFYFWVTETQFGWIVGMMGLSAACSCVLTGMLRNKIGTRLTVLLFGTLTTIGWILIIFPSNPAMLMIGRFFCGLGAGSYSYIVPMYIGEISSNEIRGKLLSMFQIALNLGILIVLIVGHFFSLRVLNIVCGSITVLYSIGFLALPESPGILIRRNLNARASLVKLRGKYHDIDSEITGIKKEHEEMKRQAQSFAEVFQAKSTKKAFIIIMCQFIFLQMSGINIVTFYLTTVFTAAGIQLEPGIASIIVVSFQMIPNFAAFAFVDRFGRKVLLYISNIFMFVGLVGVGIYFTLRDAGNSVEGLGWLPILSLTTFVIAFCIGMGPVTYILFGELFMPSAKVFVAPIGQTFNFVLTFAVGLVFPMLVSSIGMGPSFFLFSGFSIIALLFTIFVIPETKGKSNAEIQELLS